MKYFEFGQEHPELMVMLHGGGVCYRGALPVAEEMAKTYHVVLVAYDGFNPNEPETEYKSLMDEAKRLGDYVVEHYSGRMDILYGISYGCRVLMEVLGDERLTITTTIADGMPPPRLPEHQEQVREGCVLLLLHRDSLRGHGTSGAEAEEIPCKDHGTDAGGCRQDSLRQGDVTELEKSGLFPDRKENRLRPV